MSYRTINGGAESCGAVPEEIFPRLIRLVTGSNGGIETFLRLVAVVLWQIEGCSPGDQWHGSYVVTENCVVFASRLEAAVRNQRELPVKLKGAFPPGAIEVVDNGSEQWEIQVTEDRRFMGICLGEQTKDGWRWLAAGLQHILQLTESLRQENRKFANDLTLSCQRELALAELCNGRERWNQVEFIRDAISHIRDKQKILLRKMDEQDQNRNQVDRLAIVNQLTGGMAHEINNPLAFVRVNAEYIRRVMVVENNSLVVQPELREKMTKALNAIVQGVDRVARIVEGLKLFSCRVSSEKETFRLLECVKDAWLIVSVGQKVEEKIDFTTSIEEGFSVFGNKQQIEQVFINLLSNAVKAINRQGGGDGWIMIQAGKEDRNVVIAVTDSGGGISEEAIKRIFEPFYTTDRSQGVGLGMSIVQGIITEHGGIIIPHVIAGGTVFRIWLPAG